MKQHSGSKIADKFKMADIIDQKDVTKHFIMMFFNCFVWMHVYSTEGFRLLKVLSSWNNGSPVTTSVWAELQFTPICLTGALKWWFWTESFPSLYILQSIGIDWYIKNRFICTPRYKVKCGDIHLIWFFVTKFKHVCMKFMITELLYRRIWTVYDYRVKLESPFIPYASDLSHKSQP